MRAQADARTYSAARVAHDVDNGSFTLSTSPESVNALRQHSAGSGNASQHFEPAPAATWGVGFGSPSAGSLAYTSDASPLLGENVLQLSPSGNGVGSSGDGGRGGFSDGRHGGGGGGEGFSGANGPKRDWSWEAEYDGVTAGHPLDSVARHLEEGMGTADIDADAGRGDGGGDGI